jgi:hypothetical protein
MQRGEHRTMLYTSTNNLNGCFEQAWVAILVGRVT